MTNEELITKHEKETGHEIADLRCGFCQLANENKKFRENVEYLLSNNGMTVRVCEGGGPEDLVQSLVVTFMKLENEIDELNSFDVPQEVANLRGQVRMLSGMTEWRDKAQVLEREIERLKKHLPDCCKSEICDSANETTHADVAAMAMNDCGRFLRGLTNDEYAELSDKICDLAHQAVKSAIKDREKEIARLKSGKFTPEEFNNLCRETALKRAAANDKLQKAYNDLYSKFCAFQLRANAVAQEASDYLVKEAIEYVGKELKL